MKSDTKLDHDVIDELEWEPSIDASRIGVAVKNGIVTLTGTVYSYPEKMTADRAAKRVLGVNGVANDIEVEVPGTIQRTDADIAAAALDALKWNTLVPEDRIKVSVSNGWITLDGDVDWNFERTTAVNALHHLTGIRGVTNQVTVKSRMSIDDVKGKIKAAFTRSAELDARHVDVETQEGKVILHGKVHSWAEKHEAEQVAWAAPGVYDVDNQLVITQ